MDKTNNQSDAGVTQRAEQWATEHGALTLTTRVWANCKHAFIAGYDFARQQAIAQHEGDEKPVDWSAPLEAVNRKTGDVRRIENVCTDYNEDPVTEGSFAVGDDFIGGWNCFSADGKNEDPDHCDWDIRNTRHASTPATPAQSLGEEFRKAIWPNEHGDGATALDLAEFVWRNEKRILAALTQRDKEVARLQSERDAAVAEVGRLRSEVFAILRRHEVSEQCFAEVASVTHAASIRAETGDTSHAE